MLFRACIFLYISWMNTLQALFRPLVRRIYLELFFFFFFFLIFILRKACRSYIPVCRDSIHLEPLAFLWMRLWKVESHITCIENSNFIYMT